MSSHIEQSTSVTLRNMSDFRMQYLQNLKDTGWPSGSETEDEFDDGYIESEDEGKPLVSKPEPEWFADPLAVVGRGCTRRKKRKRMTYDVNGCQVSK
jgi:hypothetical protein